MEKSRDEKKICVLQSVLIHAYLPLIRVLDGICYVIYR